MSADPRLIHAGRRRTSLTAACFGILASAAICIAQGADDPAPASAPAASASAASTTADASAPVKPIAAMKAARAANGLLLDVVNTGEHYLAVGGNGDIVVSNDGAQWAQVESPVDVTLTGVMFADSRQGWAVGHDASILHTADGGRSWIVQNYQPELNAPLFSVLALDAQKAVAVGAFGTLKMTEDGGARWSDVDAPAILKDKLHLNAVTRLANGNILIVGEGGLAGVSSDGHDWKKLSPPYDGSFFGALPWGAQGAIAFGMRGNIYLTSDVGADQWQKVDAQTTSSFFGGVVLPNGEVVLVGADDEVVAVGADGAAHRLIGSSPRAGQATTYTAGIKDKNGLIVVGEAGVDRIALTR
jgi:photosystem II stability/assembly factor-like uncharacterized protein